MSVDAAPRIVTAELDLPPAREQAAKQNDFSLSAATLGSCPWAEIGVRRDRGSRDACDDFRDDLFGRVLPALDPDVIDLANRALVRGTLERADGTPIPVDAPDRGTLVASVIRRSVVQYGAVGSVIMVDPIPDAGSNIPSCLSRSAPPQSCDFQVTGSRAGTDMLDAVTEGGAPATHVDLFPAVCPEAPTCRAVRDGVVTRVDSHHLKATYSRARAEEIWRLIREAWRGDER